MKNSAKLLSHLRMFEENRQAREADLKKATSRENYAEVIADCFTPCAQAILAGYFKVVNTAEGNELIREIHPTALELYYHEEGEGGFKDPIMYHTNDRKIAEHRRKKKPEEYFKKRGIPGLPYFPFGNENPLTSGIDITFENPLAQYRASFLIREYELICELGRLQVPGRPILLGTTDKFLRCFKIFMKMCVNLCKETFVIIISLLGYYT